MTIEVDQQDLVSLVLGTCPDSPLFDNPLISKYGMYIGGFRDEWQWKNFALQKASVEELKEIYTLCKESWKRV